VLWDTRASSTCELIHDFMVALGEADRAPMDSLTAMYTGILTDTGGFSYATSPKLFRLAADLAERGVDTLGLHDAVFNSYSEKRLRLLAFCLHERMEVVPEFGVAIIGLSQEDHQKYLIRRGDLEGIVNYPLKVRDIGVSVLVAERKTEVKLSFRSKGEVSVQKICREEFSGGGHRNASGGSSVLTLQETIQKIRDLLPHYFSDQNRPQA
jgi:phosphoesterase RecJ-like protein